MKKTIAISILATALLGAGFVAGCEEEAAEESAAAAESAEGATQAKRVEVDVHGTGYDPDSIQATAGQPLTLVFTRSTEEGCGDVLAIPDYDVEKDLPLNQPVEVTITPEDSGEIAFTCGMNMYKGRIVVN